MPPRELREAQLEVVLGQLLSHPNLVHTLAHATVELPPDSLVPFSQVKQKKVGAAPTHRHTGTHTHTHMHTHTNTHTLAHARSLAHSHGLAQYLCLRMCGTQSSRCSRVLLRVHPPSLAHTQKAAAKARAAKQSGHCPVSPGGNAPSRLSFQAPSKAHAPAGGADSERPTPAPSLPSAASLLGTAAACPPCLQPSSSASAAAGPARLASVPSERAANPLVSAVGASSASNTGAGAVQQSGVCNVVEGHSSKQVQEQPCGGSLFGGSQVQQHKAAVEGGVEQPQQELPQPAQQDGQEGGGEGAVRRLCDELQDVDAELLGDDPAYWFR